MNALRLVNLVVASTLLSGCTMINSMGLSGQSAMRIEVEVYNGALTKTIDSQLAELSGAVGIVPTAMEKIRRDAVVSQCRLGCFGEKDFSVKPDKSTESGTSTKVTKMVASNGKAGNQPKIATEAIDLELGHSPCSKFGKEWRISTSDNDPFDFIIENKNEDAHHRVCFLLSDIFDGATLISESAEKYSPTPGLAANASTQERHSLIRHDLAGVYEVGAQLSNIAKLLSIEEVRVMSQSPRARIEFMQFVSGAAELGKVITSRADALQHQLKPGSGIIANRLPTATYLQTASPTKYLNIGEWTESGTNSILKDDQASRVVTALANDHDWTLINTAYATGRGKVAMAFIKDDIGNWSLKSYENDPRELLEAYKDVGLAAVKAAADIVKGPAAGLSRLDSLADAADRFALGKTAPTEISELKPLRDYTVEQLKALVTDTTNREATLTLEIEGLDKKIEEENHKLEELKNTLDDKKTGLDTALGDNSTDDQVTAAQEYALAKRDFDEKTAEIEQLTSEKESVQAQIDALPTTLQTQSKLVLTQYKATLEKLQEANL